MRFFSIFGRRRTQQKATTKRLARRALVGFEPLEDRRVLAISSLTVSSPMLFSALAASDGGTDANILEVIDLTIQNGGSINANDNWAGSVPNSDATPPIVINATGNVLIEADLGGALDTGIFAENRTQGGHGADISLVVDGNFTMQSGATISSSRIGFANASPKNAGDITIDVGGDIDLQPGSIVAANDPGGQAGDISISSARLVHIDGLVSSGPSTNVLATKLTGFVLERGNTTQVGGKITVISTYACALGCPGITISTDGILVSQGEDPASDKIELQACGIVVNGLIASVAKKSNGTDDLGNRPVVVLVSGEGITVNGQDLGSAGPNQGRIRADYILGEHPVSHRLDLFARNEVLVNGPATGTIFAVGSNGGTSTNQDGGQIRVISTEGGITATGKAFQASATPGGGSNGGDISLLASRDILLDNNSITPVGATIEARGDNNASGGYGAGGTIDIRSFNRSITWRNGLGDVRPTGTDLIPLLTNPGVVTLTYNTTINILGTSFPNDGNNPPTTPTVVQNTTGGNPALPDGVVLPLCDPDEGPEIKLDFGDAPENPIVPGDYPTTVANDGARHVIVAGFNLGAIVDDELDGQPNGTATGDDEAPLAGPDDEDGVVFNGPFVPGLTTSITVTLTNTANLLFPVLNAWFDWNGDGDWLEAGEQVFTDVALAAGPNNLSVSVPLTAVVDVNGAPTFARFRLSTDADADAVTPTGLASTGLARNGEVEDYKLHIFPYWTSKCAVITQIGNCFAIPDVLVDVDSGPAVFDVTKVGTLAPATKSIQAAIDYINANGDINGDGMLLVAVTAKDTLVESAACGGIPFIGRDLGGEGTENFIVTNPSGQQLYVMGNSVNIKAADSTKPVATIKSSVGKVTYMDIHGLNSNVAGILVGGATAAEKNASAVLVKNTSAQNNVGGVGILVNDNIVEVSGSQHITGNKVGIRIIGDNNVLRTNNEIMKNSGLGIEVFGKFNEITDQDVGKSGNPNGAGGIEITGDSNKVKDSTIAYNTSNGVNTGNGVKIIGKSNVVDGNEILSNAADAIWASGDSNQFLSNDIFSNGIGNGGDGIDVAGNSNLIKGNKIGDKLKGNGGDGIHVVGNTNTIDQNEIYNNFGDGIDLSGDSNTISNNKVGDKSKGGNGQSNVAGNRDGIRVTGKTNCLDSNTVNANKGFGIYIALGTSTGNKLKNNKSNTDSAGGGNENGLAEFRFDAIIVNQGGNKKDNANFTSTAIGSYE